MLRFSEQCNFIFKEKTQEYEGTSATLPENVVEEIFESELNEFYRPKIQMSTIKQVTSEMTAVQKRTIMDILRDIRTTVKKFIEGINR